MSELSELKAQVAAMQAERSLDLAYSKIDAALAVEAQFAPPIIGKVIKSQIGQLIANEDTSQESTNTKVRSLLESPEIKSLLLRAQGAEPIDQPVATQRPSVPAEKPASEPAPAAPPAEPKRKTLGEMLNEVKTGQAKFGMGRY